MDGGGEGSFRNGQIGKVFEANILGLKLLGSLVIIVDI